MVENYNKGMVDGMTLDKEDLVLLYCVMALCIGYAAFIWLCKAIVFFGTTT